MKEAPVLDFLKVHPRTALWWVQRETCRRCENVKHRPHKPSPSKTNTSGSGIGMSCKLVKRGPDSSCISAREGNRCGPDAKLFVPIK